MLRIMNRFRFFGALLGALLVLSSCFTPLEQDILDEENPPNLADYEALWNPALLHRYTVRITRAEWDRLNQDMVDYAAQYGRARTGGYYKSTLVYQGPNGDRTVEEVGFRTRGNTSRGNASFRPEYEPGQFRRAHFVLKFNETFEQDRSERRLFNLRSLNLKYGHEPSGFAREMWAYNSMHKLGIPSPRAGTAFLRVEILEPDDGNPETDDVTGVDFGLYTQIEPVNKSFLTRRWGKDNNDGPLFKNLYQDGGPALLTPDNRWNSIDNTGTTWFDPSDLWGVEHWQTNYRPSYDLTTGTDNLTPAQISARFTPLRTLISELDSRSGDTLKTWLDTNFDMPAYFKYMAFNWLYGMPDDYRSMGNNYYLYFPNQGGKAAFIPYDYDHGLGKGWFPYDTDTVGLFDVPTSPDFPPADPALQRWGPFGTERSRPLVDKVLAISAYREAYLQAVEAQLADESVFSYAAFLQTYDQVRTAAEGLDIYGPDGSATSLPADPGVSDYFSTRISTALAEFDEIENGTPVDPSSVSLAYGAGFTVLNGITAMAYSGTSAQDFTVNATASGPGTQVRFRLQTEGGTNIGDPIVDTEAPFTATFSKAKNPMAFDGNNQRRHERFRFTAELLSSTGTVLATAESLLAAEVFNHGFSSLTNNGDGTWTFRFRPSAENISPIEGVYLRGNLTQLGDTGWNNLSPMNGPDGEGVYSQTVTASSGQLYKFFVDTGHPDFPAVGYQGLWTPDFQNPLASLSANWDSIVP